jgi:hypothetical protein
MSFNFFKHYYLGKLVARFFLWGGIAFSFGIIWYNLRCYDGSQWTNARSDLEGANFYGIDNKNRPYHIYSPSVVRYTNHLYHFIEPIATLKDNQPIKISGKKGIYDQNKQALYLLGNILLLSKGRLHIQTESAFMNLKNQNTCGRSFIWGHGELGQFKAAGFELEEKKLRLTGPASLRISFKKRKTFR